MPDTTLCAYCNSAIPAGAKTCPMCGADNQPDYLEEIVAPAAVAAPIPPVLPDEWQSAEEVVQPAEPVAPAPVFPRVQPAPPASNNTNRYILIGVIAVVVLCLCTGAVLIAGLRAFNGF